MKYKLKSCSVFKRQLFVSVSKRRKLKDTPSGMTAPVELTKVKQLKHQCFCAAKKLEFMLSWLQKFGFQLLELEPMLQVEYCKYSGHITRSDKIRDLSN